MSISKLLYVRRLLPGIALLSLAACTAAHAQTAAEMMTTTAVGSTVDAATTTNLPIVSILDKAKQAAGQIQGQNAQTEAMLKEMEAFAPPSPEQQVQLDAGRSKLDAKQYKEAQGAYESAIALNYRNFEAHFGLGLSMYNQGDLIGARFEFSQLASLAPSRLEGHYNLGVVLARLGRTDDALTELGEAAKVGKDRVLPSVLISVYRSIAALQVAKGDSAGAAKTFQDALDLQPADASLALSLAEILYQNEKKADKGKVDSGKVGDAMAYAYKVLAQDPNNTRATLLVADIYSSQGLTSRAIRELDRVLGASIPDADRATLVYKKAQLLLSSGNKAEAMKALEVATQLNPTNSIAQYQLGRLALEAKMMDKALAAFNASAKSNPTGPETALALALVQDSKGDAAEAYKSAIAVTKLTTDPAYLATANLIAGKNAYRSKQYGIAKRVLQSTNSAEGLLWLGLSSYSLKDYAGAIAALEGSAKLDPSNTLVQANLGAAYLAASRYSEAQNTLDALVKVTPSNAQAWYNLGWALRNLSRDTESKAAFKQSANLGYTPANKELKAK